MTTTTRTVKTLADKLAAAIDARNKLNEKITELEAKVAAEAAMANVAPGYLVTLQVGRAETRRTVAGSVIARFEDEKGIDRVKVLCGTGAETELFEVAVTALDSAEAPAAAE